MGTVVRLVDVVAALGWATAVLLALLDVVEPGPPGEPTAWALLISAGSAAVTAIAWLSRHLDGYREGMDDGLRAAQIVRLPERPHERL